MANITFGNGDILIKMQEENPFPNQQVSVFYADGSMTTNKSWDVLRSGMTVDEYLFCEGDMGTLKMWLMGGYIRLHFDDTMDDYRKIEYVA